MSKDWDWVDEQEEKNKEERSKDYFTIQEGANKFLLLSYAAPLQQVYEGGKYRVARDGDTGVSVKGVCWVAQLEDKEWHLKQAKLPYTVIKYIRILRDNDEWEFDVPFPHLLTLTAKGAGTKEVEYSLQPSPKKTEIPQALIEELGKKPTPEEIVERIKAKDGGSKPDYPQGDYDPDF